MKKLFLLLAAGSIAMNVGAQERHDLPMQKARTIGVTGETSHPASINLLKPIHKSGAGKTTGLSSERWYSYTDYMELKSAFDRGTTSGSPDFIDNYDAFMWRDTFGVVAYSNLTEYNTLVSVGSLIDPTFNGYNRTDLYDAVYGAGNYIKVGASNSYTWDSIYIGGVYRGPAVPTSPGIVDTLRIALFHDVPAIYTASTSTMFTGFTQTTTHYGTVNIMTEQFDSINRVAITPQSPFPAYGGSNPVQYMDVLLKSTDTNSLYLMTRSLPITVGKYYYDGSAGSSAPSPISVGGGQLIGATMTFISGDPATHGPSGSLSKLPGDTLVSYLKAPYFRRNVFQQRIEYYTPNDPTTSTTIVTDWAPKLPNDQNEGLYKVAPFTPIIAGKYQIYSPTWSWSATNTSGAEVAYVYQHPRMSYHIVCSACVAVPESVNNTTVVDNVTATPNPATNEVNINFTLAQASNVTISLTNVVGQTVATKSISNTANGTATFNTAALASGVYVYTLSANGAKTTGRVVVAH